jgi:hypothetical protein
LGWRTARGNKKIEKLEKIKIWLSINLLNRGCLMFTTTSDCPSRPKSDGDAKDDDETRDETHAGTFCANRGRPTKEQTQSLC